MEPDDELDDRVREVYRRPLPGEQAARERLLARLRREPVPRAFRRGWWLDPDALHAPPLFAAASVLVALLIGAWGGARWAGARHDRAAAEAIRSPRREPTPASPSAAASMNVTFAFRAPGAHRVCLVGDFNGWDPNATPLRPAATGEVWTVDLPVSRGLHTYAFIVDGVDWSVDPAAPLAAETTFGRRNALLIVGEGSRL